MVSKLFVPVDHHLGINRCPLAEMKTETVSWRHVWVPRDISKAFLDSLWTIPTSENEELH